MGKFIKHQSLDGQHYFTLLAKNGETIAVSEMYKSKASRDKGIRSVKANAGRYEILENRVNVWAKNKGIHEHSTALIQAKYGKKEVNELIADIESGNIESAADNIGDVIVTIINTAYKLNLNVLDCLEKALIEIEGRQGRMIEGEFVKYNK